MAINREEFTKAGTLDLKDKGLGEIDYRNAISRAYYGMYHASLEISYDMPSHENVPSNIGVHAQLICHFANFPAISPKFPFALTSVIRKHGHDLKIAKVARQKADYYLQDDVGVEHYNAHKDNLDEMEKTLRSITRELKAAS